MFRLDLGNTTAKPSRSRSHNPCRPRLCRDTSPHSIFSRRAICSIRSLPRLLGLIDPNPMARTVSCYEPYAAIWSDAEIAHGIQSVIEEGRGRNDRRQAGRSLRIDVAERSSTFCIPEGSVRRRVDPLSFSASELLDDAGGRNSTYSIFVIGRREPEIAVGTCFDIVRVNEWIDRLLRVQLHPRQELQC